MVQREKPDKGSGAHAEAAAERGKRAVVLFCNDWGDPLYPERYQRPPQHDAVIKVTKAPQWVPYFKFEV